VIEVALNDSIDLFFFPDFMSAFRTGRVVAIAATLAFVASCSDVTAPLALEGRPIALAFSIGGFGAPSRQLELRGDTVIARRRPFNWVPGGPTDSVRVVPSAEAWRAFWNAADDAGVQKWHPEYEAEGVLDGEGWSIRLASDRREINSWGSNAYPDRNGREHELEVPAEFQAFKSALNALVGVTAWF